MDLPAKRFTVMIIPEGSHQVRRFAVRSSVVKGVLALTVVLALGLTGLIADYVLTNLDRNELHRLQVENLSQREELNHLVVKLEDLRQEMMVLAQNDAKVRVMAKLSAPKGDSIAGVGGPAREGDVNREFSEIQLRITKYGARLICVVKARKRFRAFLTTNVHCLLLSLRVGLPKVG